MTDAKEYALFFDPKALAVAERKNDDGTARWTVMSGEDEVRSFSEANAAREMIVARGCAIVAMAERIRAGFRVREVTAAGAERFILMDEDRNLLSRHASEPAATAFADKLDRAGNAWREHLGMAGVTTNVEQELYVINTGSGYSCLGFDVCQREANQLIERLVLEELGDVVANRGSLAQYALYRAALSMVGKRDLGTWFAPGTDSRVKTILEAARDNGTRLRLHYGDVETGAAWSDKPESGKIGRSMGPLKVPLLIRTRRSSGGEAILTNCIVKIEGAATKRVLFAHPGFHIRQDQEPEAVDPVDLAERNGIRFVSDRKGWFWGTHEDVGFLNGPFETKEEAAREAVNCLPEPEVAELNMPAPR